MRVTVLLLSGCATLAALPLLAAGGAASNASTAETTAIASADAEAAGSVAGSIEVRKRIKTRGATGGGDFVLWLEPAEALPPVEGATVMVEQIKREFIPHVSVAQVGSKLVFRNSDSVDHNVLSKDDCCAMDEDLAEGADYERALGTAGVAEVICRIHPEMSAYVVVVPSPYFVKTKVEREEVDGKKVYRATYELPDVPPGEYTLHVWNKRLEGRQQQVEVVAGEQLRADHGWD